MLSRCCKKDIYVMVDYYVCGLCHMACDAIDSSAINLFLIEKDFYDDTRRKTKTQELIGAA